MKKYKNSPPIPHLMQAHQALAILNAKLVGRPGTGSYPAPSPDRTLSVVMEARGTGISIQMFVSNIQNHRG